MSKPHKMEDTITSDDILGKDVIDHKGNLIGVSTQLHINKNTKELQGISIDCGFMKPFVFVGVELIKTFGVHAIYITHSPKPAYMGLLVFDRKGVKIGKIKDASFTRKNALNELYVRQGFLKTIAIPASSIKQKGTNIILKIDIEQLDEVARSLPHQSSHKD